MKAKFLALLAAAFFLFSCGTTYNSTSDNAAYNVEIPVGIKSSFRAQYPDATNIVWSNYDAANVPIDWELNGWTPLQSNDYVATFVMGGDKYYSWYNANGDWIGSSFTVSDFSRIPYAVSSMLKDKYSTYTLENAQRASTTNKAVYQLNLKNAEDAKIVLLVDADGTVLKEKTNP